MLGAAQSEDSVDSSVGRKSRKRKPNKATRVEPEDAKQRSPDVVPCEPRRITQLVEVNSPGKDASLRRRRRRKGADNAESVATIDMIPNTVETPPPPNNPLFPEKTPENRPEGHEVTHVNFDEVENKLEQMFAGIDNRPSKIKGNPFIL